MTDVEEQLLPGITEDVTLTHIAPKLSWKDFHALASVSRTWQKAIQSRMVYNERIRSKATETLVVVKHLDDDADKPVASLYSVREKKFYRLPPIPRSLGEISPLCPFLTSNGTLYVINGSRDASQVFMLDLAGQGQWEEFRTERSPPKLELSDAETSSYVSYARKGDDTFVREGCTHWCLSHAWKYHINAVGNRTTVVPVSHKCSRKFHLEVDKIPQNWFSCDRKGNLSIRAVGKYHHVDYYDLGSEVFTHLHAISRRIEPAVGTIRDPIDVEPLYILQLNNELLAIAHWRDHALNDGYCMIQTRGFRSASREIVWERVPHPASFLNGHTTFAMCPIQL